MNSLDHARENARPDCPKCGGNGTFMYDHSHSTVCDLCCKHDRGWWLLTDCYAGYVAGRENWCCRAGCGKIVHERPA